MTVKKGPAAIGRVPGGYHVWSGKRRCQGQYSAGQSLGRANQIRRDSSRLMCPEPTGTPSSRHGLISDEKNAMLASHSVERSELLNRMHPHAPGPLHQRLENHRGHFPREPRQGVVQLADDVE